MRRGWVIAGVVVVVGVVGGAGTVVLQQRAAVHAAAEAKARDRREASAVAVRFLQDWQTGKYADMAAVTVQGKDAGASYSTMRKRLQATAVQVRPGALATNGASLPYSVHLQLKGLGPLDWTNTVALVKQPGGWKVAFTPGAVYPGLLPGQQLTRSTPTLTRGHLAFRNGTEIRGFSDDLAGNVLGVVSGTTGKTGLERLYDTQLTGSSGGRVEISGAASPTLIKNYPATAAGTVTTTLDLPLQQAAERALSGVPEKAALVVLDVATGEVRAVANRPVQGLPAAFSSYAPGSVFKIVTATAALLNGFTPATPVDCPATAVFGKAFKNDEPLPPHLTLTTAFAKSCNTAFLGIANKLPQGSLRKTAALYGFGSGKLLETHSSTGGQVPVPGGTAEAYADAIGQGSVEASPLLVASMAAAVGSGTWHAPHLVASTHAPSTPLPAGVATSMRTLMRAVVTQGTAATAGLPGLVFGKTGTAQYGTTLPLRSHAWFAGYRGPLAFCVFVETGTSGGDTAAPVAARFLAGLPG